MNSLNEITHPKVSDDRNQHVNECAIAATARMTIFIALKIDKHRIIWAQIPEKIKKRNHKFVKLIYLNLHIFFRSFV